MVPIGPAILTLLGPLLADPTPRALLSDEWKELDRILLQTSRTADSGSFDIALGGYIKSTYRHTDDPVFTKDPMTFTDLGTVSGLSIDSMALQVRGELDDTTFTLSYNPERDRIRSAYVRLRPTDWLRVTWGRFKAPFLRSRSIRTTRLLFPARTLLATATGPRDLGMRLDFDYAELARLTLAVQNGEDELGDDYFVMSRLSLDLLGGGARSYEGAYRAGDDTRLSIGLAAADDRTIPDGRLLAADFALTRNRFSLAGEVVDQGDDFGAFELGLLDPVSSIQRAGNTPYGLTAGWLLVADELELASRWEDFDDPQEMRRLSLALDWYRDSHDSKWQLSWQRVFSSLPLLESDVLALSLVTAL